MAGAPVTPELLCEVTGHSMEDVLGALAAACDTRLLTDHADGYRFAQTSCVRRLSRISQPAGSGSGTDGWVLQSLGSRTTSGRDGPLRSRGLSARGRS